MGGWVWVGGTSELYFIVLLCGGTMVQHGLQQCPARLYKYHRKQASSVILVVTALLAVAMVQALLLPND